MGNLQVTPTPQPIYPDGYQDSFTIRNNGPYTVYADSDGTVSNESLPIPATGYLVWDAERPLYLRCDTVPSVIYGSDYSSSVSITRNSQPAVFGNETDSLVFKSSTFSNDVFGSGISIRNPVPIDCSAYQSLDLCIINGDQIPIGTGISAGRSFSVAVAWFDSNMNRASTDTYSVPFACLDTPAIAPGANGAPPAQIANPELAGSHVTVRVKGKYFQVCILTSHANDSLLNPVTCTILGTTRELNEGIRFTAYDAMPHMGAGGVTPLKFTQLGSDGWVLTNTSYVVDNAWPNLYLPKISNEIELVWNSFETITVAGVIQFQGFGNTAARWAQSVTIPAVPLDTPGSAIIRMPVSQPVQMKVTTRPKKAGPVDLTDFALAIKYL